MDKRSDDKNNSREYHGANMQWILCGSSVGAVHRLTQMDDKKQAKRFLDDIIGTEKDDGDKPESQS